jgi:hypothetical protein
LVRALWVAATLLLIPSSAGAQATLHTRFIEARAGANLVGNTYRVRQEKATTGMGVSAGVFLASYWVAELEAWFRSSSPECCTGREQLISLNAARLYAAGGLQPYLAGGLALLRSQSADPAAAAKVRLQVQVTAGVRVPLGRRMALDLDLRGNGGGSTMIVRPTIGAAYFF